MNIPRPRGRCANGHHSFWVFDTDEQASCPECKKDYQVLLSAFDMLESIEAALEILGGSKYDPEATACSYLEQALKKARGE